MTRQKTRFPLGLFCLCLLFLWIAVHAYPYFFDSLTDNYREIQTYNLDSSVILNATKEALASPWFQYRNSDYGHLYYNLAMALASLYALFAPLTDHGIFFILRLVSLLGGLCSLTIVFVFARRILGEIEAVFAAAVLAFTPNFVEFCTEVHPDTCQLFLLVLSLYFLARAFEGTLTAGGTVQFRSLKADFKFVLGASAAAGAAFGTKYQGMLLIPLLALAASMVPTVQVSDRAYALATRMLVALSLPLALGFGLIARTAYPLHLLLFMGLTDIAYLRSGSIYWDIQAFRVGCIVAAILCLAVAAAHVCGFDFTKIRTKLTRIYIYLATGFAFFVAFAVSSPWLLKRLQFLSALYYRSLSVHGESVGFRWVAPLADYQQYFTYGICAMALLGAGLLLAALIRRKIRIVDLTFLWVLIFSLIFMTLLITTINRVAMIYLLPAAPMVILLAAFGLHEIRLLLPRWLDPPKVAIAAAGLASLLALAQAWRGGSVLVQDLSLVTALTPENRAMAAWLERCVSARTRILAAAYTYVPPEFETVRFGGGGQYYYYDLAKPDLITLKLADVASDIRYAEGQAGVPGFDATGPARYYNLILHSGRWRAGPTFGPFTVYVKKDAAGLNANCR